MIKWDNLKKRKGDMKKLTAGIFTVLMGLVSVNAANAAVASKAYVDAKAATEASAAQSAAETTAANALSSAKLELEGKIDAKVAQTAYDTKVAELAQADTTNLQAAKDYADGLDAAQKTAFETADSAINDKIGTVAEGKTVVQMIADAQSSATYDDAELRGLIGDNADAISAMDAAYKTADTQVLTDAKAYADGLATNYDTAGSAATAKSEAIEAAAADATSKANQALTDAKAYADGLATNYDSAGSAATAKSEAIEAAAADATSKANQALTDAKAYADEKDEALKTDLEGQIATASGSATQVANDLASYKTTNNAAVAAAKKAGDDAQADLDAYKSSNDTAVAAAKTQADKGVADAATAQSAAEAAQAAADAAQSAADAAQADANQALADAAAAQSAAEAAQTQADKGVADAATAKSAADAAQATANAAIPAPTDECSNPTNKCVLTFNNSAYTWEVIERATGETGF